MYLDEESFLNLYKALVRPHLEYANQIWAPKLQRQIDSIENVQKRATKLLPGYENLCYENRLRQERLKRRNTLGCQDQYAAQNSNHARPPIPSQPTTQKVFFQWHTQYDPTMKHSQCETVYVSCSKDCPLNWLTPSEFFKFSQLTN